jgi:acetolactate synthase-1/2/3 large subunit
MSNAMIGLHTAYHDSTPLVVLVGQVERWEAGRMALQEQNYSRLLSDVTKLVIEVNEPAQASEAMARAFHVAESGTPGPVAVIIPEDVFDAETDAPRARPRPAALAGPRTEDLDRLAEMLAAAERPIVWAGAAVNPADVADVARLSEEWGLPVMPTHRRPHLFDPAHPNYGGYASGRPPREQMDEWRQTDLLVALGERLSVSTTQGFTFPMAPEPQMPLVHIWPGPEEVGRVFRPDLGMACEPAAVVRALLARGAPAGAAKRRGWIERLHALHHKVTKPEWQPTEDGVNFSAVVAAIGRRLDDDATVTTDAGNFSSFVQRYLQIKPGQMYLNSVVGAMGAGMPMAVAACLRRPGTQVVGFAGDGGALMTGNELATARQYGVNPVFVISDNGCYGTITQHHDLRYPGRPYQAATELTNPDFALWATAFGAKGLTIRDEAEVEPVIAEALSTHDRPVVVHVHSSLQQISAWRRRDGQH